MSQLICHFGRTWRFFIPPLTPFSALAFFVPKDFLGLSVPRNMGPSVPSSMGPSVPSSHRFASDSKVSNSLCLLNIFFLISGLKDNLCPLSDSGLSVPSIYGVAIRLVLCLVNMFSFFFFNLGIKGLSVLPAGPGTIAAPSIYGVASVD